jgi:hypothetical protein
MMWVFAVEVGALSLKWEAPGDCQRADTVSAQVESLIGRPLTSVEAPSFEVNVTPTGKGFRLELVTLDEARGTRSSRTFEGGGCASVTDAAGVAMALAIRAQAEAEKSPDTQASAADVQREEPRAPPQQPAAPSQVSAKPVPAAGAEVAVNPRVQMALAAAVILDTAALPHPAPGVAVAVGARVSALRGELQGLALLPNETEASAGGRGEFGLLAGALLACYERSEVVGTATAAACVGVEVGRMSGEGSGVTNPDVGDAPWWAARAEVGAVLRASRGLGFAVRAGIAAPVSRPRFELDGVELHRPAALTLRAALGVEVWP